MQIQIRVDGIVSNSFHKSRLKILVAPLFWEGKNLLTHTQKNLPDASTVWYQQFSSRQTEERRWSLKLGLCMCGVTGNRRFRKWTGVYVKKRERHNGKCLDEHEDHEEKRTGSIQTENLKLEKCH